MFGYEDQLDVEFRALIAQNNAKKTRDSYLSPLLPAPFARLDRSCTAVARPSSNSNPIDIHQLYAQSRNVASGGGAVSRTVVEPKKRKKDADAGKKKKKKKGDPKGREKEKVMVMGPDGVEVEADSEDEEEEDMFDRAKKVKIKGFKDIGEKRYIRDLFSICWSNSPEGKQILGGEGKGLKEMNPPPMKIQQTDRSPYKTYGKDNWFGNVRIKFIPPGPSNQGEIRAVDVKGEAVLVLGPLSEKVYDDLHHLLTKRIQKNKNYEEEAKKDFSELVKLSGLPKFKSAKYSFIQSIGGDANVEGCGLEFDAGGGIAAVRADPSKKLDKTYLSNNKDVMMSTPTDFKSGVNDFKLHYGTIKGGNRNKDVGDKLRLIYKYLWTKASESPKRHKYFMKHIQPQYVEITAPK